MANKSIYVDIDEFIQKEAVIKQNFLELEQLIKEYRKMIEETKTIYDTNSARYFRNAVLNYMDIVSVKVDNELNNQVNMLDTVKREYSEALNSISNMIISDERN